MKRFSSRAKIIESARVLFTEKGYVGASTQSIALQAEVSHSLIFHHFKNKEALWQAVKQSIACDQDDLSKTLPPITLSFPDFLATLVRQSIDFYSTHPDIVRMMSWQRLEGNIQVKAVSPSAEVEAWLGAIRHYQAVGDLDSNLPPQFVMGFILSITSAAALDYPVWIQSEKERLEYIKFCIARLKQAFFLK